MQKQMISTAQKNLVPVSRQAACEGIVLLENKEAILPIRAGQTLSLFGRCQINTYRSGTGSGGAVNVPYAVSALDGLRANPKIEINEELVSIYQDWIALNPFDDGGGAWAAEPWFQHEMPLNEDIVNQAATRSDIAVVFIGRTAGEDQDAADAPGSYRLTELELAMLTQVTASFKQVIVVLNTTNIIDMSWLDSLPHHQSIKAVLYSWAAGMEGGHALADILSGDVSPSGRLTDTIAYHLADYPSSANFGRKDFNCYAEDIYVGYRYFETFKPEAVRYEFGAGLSYTDFTINLTSMMVAGSGKEAKLLFHTSVKNTGSQFSGKEVIQVYCEAPQGKLGKPARVLVGFAKTKELQPGETDNILITVPVSQLASFDDSGITGHANCYVLEAGSYRFHLGSSVRKTVAEVATFDVDSLLVTTKLNEALAPSRAFRRLKPGARRADGYYEIADEAVPLRTISLQERIDANIPAEIQYTGDQGIKLHDVKTGRAPMESFIAQLSREDLAAIVRGEGMCSPKVTPGTASAFGGVTDNLFNFGIPIAAAADGPSGIRMDSGHQATQVPIGTLLGCTWNQMLNEQLFNLVGKELHANQIDTLLGPGINIHRHPLNGRNFEYFSEDPFLTGSMAAAQTRGLSDAGVSGTIKHFAANDQETARMDVDSVISQRALREVHIRAFEMAVKEGRATTIMTAYNPVNGIWAASNYDLNTTILRGEWGYTGIVMSDWWAKMNDPVNGGKESKTFTSFMVRAQNDLYMVVEHDGAQHNAMGDDTIASLENGSLTVAELQRSAINICRFIMNAPVMDRPLKAFDPIKAFTPISTATESTLAVTSMSEHIPLTTNANVSLIVEVAEAGIYQCNGVMHYSRNSLAQSSCSLSLNGDYCMSLSVNGTEGNTVTVEGTKIKLDKGRYELSVNFVKPGLVLESLSFIKE